jgi:hypothetical protein
LFDATEFGALRGPTIQEKITAELRMPLDLRDLLIRLIGKHGITHTTGEYKAAIKEREGTLFNLMRDPAKTPKGRPSRSMDHNKIHIVISAKPQERPLLQ